MTLQLNRFYFSETCTIGTLSINDKFECFTLEDTVREEGVKIPSKTAIPKGRYTVKITYSPTFKKRLPILLNVPMFSGIRIHVGNYAKDTRGCILVGQSAEPQKERILFSRKAMRSLMAKLIEEPAIDIIVQ